MPDDAVLDSPDIELGTPDTGDPGEGAAEPPQGDGSGDPGGADPSTDPGDGQSASGVALWKTVKEQLKGLDPKTTAAVRHALFKAEELGKKFPDGLSKVDETLASIRRLSDNPDIPDAVPIEQLVEDTLAERTFWREFDDKFQAGDEGLIAQMVDANPASFQRLVPAALNKFAELNPDGYSSMIGSVALQYMDEAQVPLQFAILDTFLAQLPDSPAAKQVINAVKSIYGTINAMREWTKKPIVPKGESKTASSDQTGADRDAELQNREMRLRDREWNTEIAPKSNKMAADEAFRIAGTKKFTADEIEKVKAAVKEEINARVAINGEYQRTLTGYLQANNKAAYIQRVNSEHKKIIPGAVRRAVDDVLAKRPANQPNAKPNGQQAQKKPNPAGNGEDGIRYDKISGYPTTVGLVVDLNRTTHKMLAEQKVAYVKGRKNPVKWD